MKKILVANRGEIALRIMKSAREMGIATVAVFSEADRNARHVRFADEAVFIGAASSSLSYLSFDKIINACQVTGADAIHPGYGFLSENADFADRVAKEGLIFIGPSPESMRIMGSKLGAKAAVAKYNIPMVPGIDTAISDKNEAKQTAIVVGFPILIKASAGGGGKGMRIVKSEIEFDEQLEVAISEAISAFGDGSVFLERYVSKPRHIEIQVLGDTHGNIVHLFERECSIQRRHQKVIEEAPSSILTSEMRTKMGECAVMVAKACNYVGVGTVEFLLDEKMNFYFLEMNTRLQVEHPVTEYITGLDLVKEQIKVARGEKLTFAQEDLTINGHSMELRVYAEDPDNNFLPSIGLLEVYQTPLGPGIRVDDAFEQGMEIPMYYDPMIAKLVTHGKDRKESIEKMKIAIQQYQIKGIKTTLPFGLFVMNHPKFISGDFDTHFIQDYYQPNVKENLTEEEEKIVALAAVYFSQKTNKKVEVSKSILGFSEWEKSRKQY